MSDRTAHTDRDDVIGRRLVVALDALPVPAGPKHLRPVSRRPRDRTLLVFAAVVLMVVVAISTEPVRAALSDGTRWIQRALFGSPWTGYYIDRVPAAGAVTTSQLRFALGDLPGIESRPSLERQNILVGPWSPDGELVPIATYTTKLYVGDRLGDVREVADVGTGRIAPRVTWIGPRTVFTVVVKPSGFWAATIDVTTGAVDQQRLATQVFRHDNPLPPPYGDDVVYFWASPDARWLALTLEPGGCGEVTSVYELATGRVFEVVDPQGRPAFAEGWLPDGRLVSAYCDFDAHRVDIFVTAAGARPDRPIASLPLTANAPQFAFDYVSDHFLVFNEDPTRVSTVTVLDGSGRVVRTARLQALGARPYFSPLGEWLAMALSRDGKFFYVRVLEQRGATLVGRSAVVSLDTGEVTFACDTGCVQMVLR